MRGWVALAITLSACGPAPLAVQKPAPDPTQQIAYIEAVARLASMNRDAETALIQGKPDRAGALITQAQHLQAQVLAAPRPTLAATEAAADLDQLYGKMLFRNRHYGWARLLFQKNAARWKNWRPQTDESAKRLKAALQEIDECDRRIHQ